MPCGAVDTETYFHYCENVDLVSVVQMESDLAAGAEQVVAAIVAKDLVMTPAPFSARDLVAAEEME